MGSMMGEASVKRAATPSSSVSNWREMHRQGYFEHHRKYQDRLHDRGIAKIRESLQLRRADTLLEIGCGYGRAMYHLLPMVKRAIGLDVAPEPFEEARQLLEGRGEFELHETNGRSLEPVSDGAVDAAFAFTVFQHIPRVMAKGMMVELRRVLRPGGRLCLQFMTGGDPAGDIVDEATEQSISYSAARVAALAEETGFEVRRIELEVLEHPEFDWYWLSAASGEV